MSVWPPLCVTSAYVASCYYGPVWMASRNPFTLRNVILVYNSWQIVFNFISVLIIVQEVWKNNLNLFGNKHYDHPTLNMVIRGHYLNKYVELLDTAFIVLRKKEAQLSFLHMYHHTLLIWSWFLNFYIGGCIDGFFGAAVNSSVHVIMYSYYTLTSLGYKCPWKRYITKVQLGQFVACAIHAIQQARLGVCHPVLVTTELWVMTSLFGLFIHFYKQSYSKKRVE